MFSQVWNMHKRKPHRLYLKFNFTIRKNNIYYVAFLFISLSFNEYIVQIVALMDYTIMKSPPEVLAKSLPLVFKDFMKNRKKACSLSLVFWYLQKK